jgi:hypothetical protein
MIPDQLIDGYLDDELDDAASDELQAWLEADEKNVRRFVQHVYLHRQLRETLLADNIARNLQESGALNESPKSALRPAEGVTARAFRNSVWSYPMLAMLLLVGAFLGSAVTWQIASMRMHRQEPVVVANPDNNAPANRPRYVATLVNVTNCRWDQNRSTAELALGSAVRPGDSLHLLEGVAEISSKLQNGGMANLQLEGPVAMTLNQNGMPSLLYGHLTGSFACDFDQFTLDTPLGLVTVSGDASIGIIAAANRIELHVFNGTATFDLWAVGLGSATKQMATSAGSSITAHVDAEGNISVERGEAREIGFMTPAALSASRLRIPAEYVATILEAKPIAYWRFEGDVNGAMPNEVGERFQCRMVGNAVRWRPGRDGSTVEFGMTEGPGYLISDDTFDLQPASYTIELWAKPAHFHHASLFSLLQWKSPQSPIGTHRMVLEICGPVSGLTSPYRETDFHPGRVRFIQESQPQVDVDCFSPQPYAVRKWQHFAAVKLPEEMQLYCNGEMVDSKVVTGSLPPGLRILMGQLLPVSPKINDEVTSRLFSGELDEVAFYDRALSGSEIHHHFELVRPESEMPPK